MCVSDIPAAGYACVVSEDSLSPSALFEGVASAAAVAVVSSALPAGLAVTSRVQRGEDRVISSQDFDCLLSCACCEKSHSFVYNS